MIAEGPGGHRIPQDSRSVFKLLILGLVLTNLDGDLK